MIDVFMGHDDDPRDLDATDDGDLAYRLTQDRVREQAREAERPSGQMPLWENL